MHAVVGRSPVQDLFDRFGYTGWRADPHGHRLKVRNHKEFVFDYTLANEEADKYIAEREAAAQAQAGSVQDRACLVPLPVDFPDLPDLPVRLTGRTRQSSLLDFAAPVAKAARKM
eukprot:Hpha_TRINITY_DN15348_c0_g2::TRINITY_DN15348_c0_g2_i3::g.89393::m.89393